MGSHKLFSESFYQNNSDVYYSTSIEKLHNATSAEEQVEVLKNIIEQRNSDDLKVLEFLAILYYESPAKHPVKRFLSRHITKSISIQQSFTDLLSDYISSQIRLVPSENQYEHYAEVVPKLVACIENFPAGTAAVKVLDSQLAKYLINYFHCCSDDLRNSELSLTKKNEIFNLEHLILRMLVHITQKLNLDQNPNKNDWIKVFGSITAWIEQLIFDEDVPMDTKSLSGILLLTVETLKSGDHAWMNLLLTSGGETHHRILDHTAGQLAVYSAIATSVPMEKLQQPNTHSDGDTPAILVLLNKLLSITEGGSEGALTLASARALLHLSKSLPRAPPTLGPLLLTPLLVFVWAHLEYHLDSVRHLAQQTLGNALTYCAWLEKSGDWAPLESLVASVRELGECRQYYWCVSHAAAVLGAKRVLRDLCPAARLLRAVTVSHLHAAAMSAISALVPHGSTEEAFSRWVEPTLAELRPDNAEALQPVLAAVVAAHPDLVGLMSGHLSAPGVPPLARLVMCCAAPACRRLLPRGVLRAAALHPVEEIRTLALSSVAQSTKSTAALSRDELDFVLYFLRYNISEQSPNFRQLMLALIKKLLKRLEDSYKVLTRPPNSATDGEHYLSFVEQLRELCFSSLLRGANFGRRSVALQLLLCTEKLQIATNWVWKEEYVETLLQHLDDSYESNKDYALQVLQLCPEQLLKKTSTSVELGSVLQQASSLTPADSVSASYKLLLLLSRLPELILEGNDHYCQGYTGPADLRATYALLQVLLERVRGEVETCEREGATGAAQHGAMFGLLHCMARVLQRDKRMVPASEPWRRLAHAVVAACTRATRSVAHVVTHAAPEGHLPTSGEHAVDATGITLEDGSQVTSQMVLVCAWRSVKEASSVLSMAAPLVAGPELVSRAGTHLAALLRRVTHRGASDTAAAGLAALATQCWRSSDRAGLARQWVHELMHVVATGAPSVTRRGAGLAAALQALLATEVQVTGRGECFHQCMATLLRLATDPGDSGPADPCDSSDPCNAYDPGDPCPTDPCDPSDLCNPSDPNVSDPGQLAAAERRALAANILRALFRHSALEAAAQAHVGAGLRLAVCGFGAAAWAERTAMSLLFSALLVRVFGVYRGPTGPARRDRLSGRLFFQRYPELYPLMMSKLSQASDMKGGDLRADVYPVLLLLGRLYPSALDGAVSSLKLSSFMRPVQQCASRAAHKTRQLAARAATSLVAPQQYWPHVTDLLSSLSPLASGNQCHGTLLQLARLLETPEGTPRPPAAGEGSPGVRGALRGSGGLLAQPCAVLVTEYVGVLNLIVWRFPELIEDEFIAEIITHLDRLLFMEPTPPTTSGREVCLAHCLLLYIVLLHNQNKPLQIATILIKSLQHTTYEVVISALNYLLILHQKLDMENCNFLKHLHEIRDGKVLEILRQNSTYVEILARGFKGEYLECRQKCLRLLTLEKGTLKYVIQEESMDDDVVIVKLLDRIENGHENVKHIYLETLLNLISERRADPDFDVRYILRVMREAFARSSSENNDSTRQVVVSCLETDMDKMMFTDAKKFDDRDRFEYRATVLATLVTLLEDDDSSIRQRAADVATTFVRTSTYRDVTLSNVSLQNAALRNIAFGNAFTENVYLNNITVKNFTCGNILIQNVTAKNITLKTVTLENAAVGNITVRNVQYENLTRENVKIENFTHGNIIIDNGTSEIFIPGNLTPNSVTTDNLTSANVTGIPPENLSPKNVIPESVTPENLAPKNLTPKNVIPENLTSENVTLADVTLDSNSLVPSASGEMLRDYLEGMEDSAALFSVVALLDFNSEVCMMDEISEECRVFDQSERYNTFLEESVWTAACADKINKLNPREENISFVLSIVQNKKYCDTFTKLCGDHLVHFQKLSSDGCGKMEETVHPKIELFIRKLRCN